MKFFDPLLDFSRYPIFKIFSFLCTYKRGGGIELGMPLSYPETQRDWWRNPMEESGEQCTVVFA
jgi:hypothetical protein